MKRVYLSKKQKGVTLIEVIIATAIIAAIMIGVLSAFNAYVRVGLSNIKKTQAAFLAEEGTEALRFMRDKSWSETLGSFQTSEQYFFEYATSSGWSAVEEEPERRFDEFERSFIIKDVYRDADTKDIVSSTSPAAVLDLDIKRAVVKVDWSSSDTPVTISTYLTNLFDE